MRKNVQPFLIVLAFAIVCFSSCHKPQPNQTETLTVSPPCDTTVCDTVGYGNMAGVVITDQKLQYHQLSDWKRKGVYTLCIDTKLKKKDEGVEIMISHTLPNGKRHLVVKAILISGVQQLVYLHLKSKFTPEISVIFWNKKTGADYKPFVKTDSTGGCGAGLTIKDKVTSTSTDTSTVLVTIDEK